MFKLSCINAPMKSNWYALGLLFEVFTKKYFRDLIYAVGYHISPIISLLCNYPLTIIINFNLSGLPSNRIFSLYASIYGVTESPFSGSSIIKVLLLIIFLIFFKVAFNQDFLTSAGNPLISAKLLSSILNCDTSESGYPNLGNELLFNSFTTALNNLCKHFPILFTEISAIFHSLCV